MTTYETLHAIASAAGIAVHEHGHGATGDRDEALSLYFVDRESTWIIVRAWSGDVKQIGQSPDDAISLAHALGHHRARVAGETALAHFDPQRTIESLRSASGEERQKAFEADALAWAHARAILTEVGFENLDAFNAREADGIKAYRVRAA